MDDKSGSRLCVLLIWDLTRNSYHFMHITIQTTPLLLKVASEGVATVSDCLFFLACLGIITSSHAYPP